MVGTLSSLSVVHVAGWIAVARIGIISWFRHLVRGTVLVKAILAVFDNSGDLANVRHVVFVSLIESAADVKPRFPSQILLF